MDIRWTLSDPVTSETWVMPINPDQMTSPHAHRTFATAKGVRRGLNLSRTFETPPEIIRWEWQGVIRTQAHYEAYVAWALKPGVIHVLDHLGRTWEVVIETFESDEKRPSQRSDWRFRYTVKCLIIRRVS